MRCSGQKGEYSVKRRESVIISRWIPGLKGGKAGVGGGPVASFITDLFFFSLVECTFVASLVSSHVIRSFTGEREIR